MSLQISDNMLSRKGDILQKEEWQVSLIVLDVLSRRQQLPRCQFPIMNDCANVLPIPGLWLPSQWFKENDHCLSVVTKHPSGNNNSARGVQKTARQQMALLSAATDFTPRKRRGEQLVVFRWVTIHSGIKISWEKKYLSTLWHKKLPGATGAFLLMTVI